MAGDAMRTTALAAAAALAIGAIATPAAADGQRGWRGAAWPIGAITRNLITPDYYGYYGGFYSYHGRNYDPGPLGCWRWHRGYRFWVC